MEAGCSNCLVYVQYLGCFPTSQENKYRNEMKDENATQYKIYISGIKHKVNLTFKIQITSFFYGKTLQSSQFIHFT